MLSCCRRGRDRGGSQSAVSSAARGRVLPPPTRMITTGCLSSESECTCSDENYRWKFAPTVIGIAALLLFAVKTRTYLASTVNATE